MGEPAGPTGVITLRKIADDTYEQHGRILMSATGRTQITISAQDFRDLFERQTIETQVVWLGEFQSRIQGTPNPNQSSFYNNQAMCWPGGAWSAQLGQLQVQSTLSGGVAVVGTNTTSQWGQFSTNETAGLFNQIAHVSRNPTFYMRWTQASSSGANTAALGWIRKGSTFTSDNTLGSICFRHDHNAEIFGVCQNRTGGVTNTTTLGMGVNATTGIYHSGRAVVRSAGASVDFYLDGVFKGTITTTIPTEGGGGQLVPGFGQYGVAAAEILIDFMAVSQQRTPG